MHPKKIGRPPNRHRKKDLKTINYIEDEEWKIIPYSQCSISNLGRVKWKKPCSRKGRKFYKEYELPLEKCTNKTSKFKNYLEVKLKYPEGIDKTDKIKYPKKAFVHILMANAFVKRKRDCTKVIHKDGDIYNNFAGIKENDYIDGNLKWVSEQEYKMQKQDDEKLDVIVKQIGKTLDDTKEDKYRRCRIIAVHTITRNISIFKSQSEAAKKLNISREKINKNLNGKNLICDDFIFAYFDEIDLLPIFCEVSGVRKSSVDKRLQLKEVQQLNKVMGVDENNNEIESM